MVVMKSPLTLHQAVSVALDRYLPSDTPRSIRALCLFRIHSMDEATLKAYLHDVHEALGYIEEVTSDRRI